MLGASGAIGAEVVQACVAAGYDVVATCRDGRLDFGPTVSCINVDVLKPVAAVASIREAAEAIKSGFYGLIYCAGITSDSPFLTMEINDWHRVVETNLTGAFISSQAVAEEMMLNSEGRLIFLGSIASKIGIRGQANYVSSKAGLEGLCKTLAEELGPYGVCSNVIAAGPVDSPMLSRAGKHRAAELKRQAPLRRLATVSDIAKSILFLLSDSASFINGQTIAVDGGLHKL